MKAILAALLLLTGCMVPREYILPEYAGPDAATINAYCAGEHFALFYLELDHEIVGTLPQLRSTAIRVVPGTRLVDVKTMDYLGGYPFRFDFKPSGVYYLYVRPQLGPPALHFKMHDRADFERLLENKSTVLFE